MSFLSLLQKHFIPLLYSLGAVALTWLVQYDPFFWDTIQLASKHAHFFFENNLQWAPLPNEIDSGHPPFLGYYLAVCWHFFGQTLPVSHWAMLPFFLLNIWLLCSLGNRITDKKIRHFFPLLVFSDPVIFTQSSLVSPDLLVMTGFLLALEGWLSARKGYIALGVLLLCGKYAWYDDRCRLNALVHLVQLGKGSHTKKHSAHHLAGSSRICSCRCFFDVAPPGNGLDRLSQGIALGQGL
jgi:hypothetical protein